MEVVRGTAERARLRLMRILNAIHAGTVAPYLPEDLTLHMYETCPYCARAMLVLGWLHVPYEREFYGYGEGADPADGGYNPKGGPVAFTGQKKLPILAGPGVPCPDGMTGLPESLDICSYIAACAGGLPSSTGRKEISEWIERFEPVMNKLCRPRVIKLPYKDYADKRDVEYAVKKYTKMGFDYAAAEAETPQLVKQASILLAELEPMLLGHCHTVGGAPCLNKWGLGMDDVLVLPLLRNMTMVKDVVWPPKVHEYLASACAKARIDLFTKHAC